MCSDLAFAVDGVALSESIVASVDVATSSRTEPSVASKQMHRGGRRRLFPIYISDSGCSRFP